MKNLLKGSSVYLAGAVEHHEAPGNWRHDITKNLFDPMGVRVYNPLIKPDWVSEYGRHENPSEYRKWMELYRRGARAEGAAAVWDVLREIRVLCKQMVSYSDFVVVNFPKKFTVGTIEEMTLAAQSGKPILVHSPDGIVSTWLPNLLLDSVLYDNRFAKDGEEFFEQCHFEDWEDLYDYIKNVDSGLINVNKFKWLFMSYFNNDLVKA